MLHTLCRRVADGVAPIVAVLASVGDGVKAGGQQTPILGQVGRAGETASHADDGDGIVLDGKGRARRGRRRLGSRRSLGAGVGLGEFRRQVAGQGVDVGMIENGGVGNDVLAGKGAVETVPQFYGHQGVHAEVEETDGGRGGGGQTHDRLELLLQEGRQDAFRVVVADCLQLGHQVIGRIRLLRGVAGQLGDQIRQERGYGLELLGEGLPVHGGGHG